MPSTMAAFASALALPSTRAGASSTCVSRGPLSARARRCAAPRMAASGDDAAAGEGPPGFDFDAIARKLAADLSAQGIAPPEMPGGGDALDPSAQAVDEDGAGAIELTLGEGGMPKVILRHKQSNQSTEVYTYGAAVTSWRARNMECLWMSEENKWEQGGKAIRGGIPICFVSFRSFFSRGGKGMWMGGRLACTDWEFCGVVFLFLFNCAVAAIWELWRPGDAWVCARGDVGD